MRIWKTMLLGILIALSLCLTGCSGLSDTESQRFAQITDTPAVTESAGAGSDSYLDADDMPDDQTDYSQYDVDQKDQSSQKKSAGKDQYNTDPVPSGKPAPVEPQEAKKKQKSGKKQKCTLQILCGTILDHMDDLAEEKKEIVPEDGVILKKTTVTFEQGDSVFDVLLRETRKRKIHMEYSFTPVYNSSYIEGIANLYEFDCGELSGWMYCVNDWYPNYGVSRYQVKAGDEIVFNYTCDLGRDLGVGQ